MKFFSGIRARLHAVVLVPMLLFFIISYSLFHFYVNNLIEEDYYRHLEQILSLEKSYIETWLNERVQDLRLLAEGCTQFDGDRGKIEEYITSFAHSQENFSSLTLADDQGYSMLITSGASGTYIGDSKVFNEAAAGRASISDIRHFETEEDIGITIATPLPTKQGRVSGTLIGRINIKQLEKLLQKIHRSQAGEVYLVDEEGYYITPPDITSVFTDDRGKQVSPVFEKKIETSIYTHAIEEREIHSPYINYAGKRVYGKYTWLEKKRWLLIGETDLQLVYRRYSGYSSFLVILILVGAILLFPIILQMSNTIAAPLRFLDKEAQRLKTEQGKINNNWEPFRRAPVEIRNLAYSFFTMSEQLSKQLEELEKITISDDLTGLYNRKHLFEEGLRYIHMSRRTNLPLACLMIDIDNFKKLNDTYGHSFGDKVLKEVGRTIRNSVRESDLPARYGGEEFAVLAYEADIEEASQLAERLRKAIEEQNHIYEPTKDESASGTVETRNVEVTISIGVAPLEEQIEGFNTKTSVKKTLEELLGKADKALYLAKDNGRNRVERWSRKEEG